jgi:hypothetical protein
MVATVVSSKPTELVAADEEDATSFSPLSFPPLSSNIDELSCTCFHFIKFNTDPPSKYGITTHKLDPSINEQ